MKTCILIIMMLGWSVISNGQTNISDRELTVEKSYNNEIYEVNPIFDYAAIVVPDRGVGSFDFDSLSSIHIQTPDIDVDVEPLAFQTSQKKYGRAGFIKGDYGTTNPLYLQGGYTLSRTNYYNLHLVGFFDHRQVSDVPSQFSRKINGGLGFDYYLTKDVKANVDVKYDRRTFGLYSTYAPQSDLPDLNQNTFENKRLALSLQTIKTFPRKWNFGLEVAGDLWSQADIGETNLSVQGATRLNVNRTWGLALHPYFETSQSAELGGIDAVGTTLSIQMDAKKFYASFGAKLNYVAESINLWPALDVRWSVGKETEMYIRSDAHVEILGGQSLARINPYVGLTPDQFEKVGSLSSDMRLDVYSDLSAETKLAFSVNYLKAQNHVNFILRPSDRRTFAIELVDFQRLQVSTQLTRQVNQWFGAGLTLRYNNYTKNMAQLLHRPVLEAEPVVTAKLLSDQLILSLKGRINDPQHILDAEGQTITSGWRKNVSFSAGWDVMDQLRIHLNADNIFNDDYQVWSGYQSFERNLSGGILFTF